MADSFGLKIGLEGEKAFKQSLSEINQSMKVLGSEMKLVASQFDANDKSVVSLASRNSVLNREIDTQKSKIEVLRSALNNAASSFGETDKRTSQWRIQLNNAEAELNNMERELDQNNEALDEAEDGFGDAGEGAEKFGDKTKKAGDDADESKDKFEKLGTVCKAVGAALAAAAAAVVSFAKDSVSTGMEFDAAMSQVAATMGTTVDQVEDLRDKAKEMGASTQYTATEAAEGLNILAMAGLSAEESIAGIETVLNLASAGGMDLSSSASYLTGVVKGFGDSMDNAQYYADLMAKGATLAATDVQGLGEAFSAGSATAAAFNQDAESMTVALLRLAEQNATGSDAAMALNRAMYDLYTPTDKAKAAMEDLGVSAYDAQGHAKDINVVIDELNAAMSGLSEEERNVYADAIFSTRGLQAFNKMTVSSAEKVESFQEGLSGASDEFGGLGAAAGQAQTQLDNLQGDVTIFESALDGLKIAISDRLTPTLRSVVSLGSESLSSITKAFEENGLSGAMDAISEALTNAIGLISEMLPTVMSAGQQLLMALVTGILENLPTIVGSFSDSAMQLVMGLVNGILENLPMITQTALEIIATLASGIGNALPELVPAMVDTVISMVDTLLDNIDKVVAAAGEIIVGLAKGIVNAIPKLVQRLPEVIRSITNFFTKNLAELVSMGVELIVQLAVGLIKAIPDVVKAIPQILAAILEGLAAGVVSIAEVGVNLVKGLWEGIKSMVSWLWDKVKGWAGNLVGKIKDAFGIHSPSTVFADIGENLGLGLGEGFVDTMKDVEKEMQEAIPTDFDLGTVNAVANVSANGVSGTSGGSLTDVLTLLKEYLPGMSNLRIVTDTGTVVGWLAPEMDTALGSLQKRKARFA